MGHQSLPQELVAIVRRLDIDGDSKIGYHEFIESMSPVSPDMIPVEAVMDRDNKVFLDQSSLAQRFSDPKKLKSAITNQSNREGRNKQLFSEPTFEDRVR